MAHDYYCPPTVSMNEPPPNICVTAVDENTFIHISILGNSVNEI